MEKTCQIKRPSLQSTGHSTSSPCLAVDHQKLPATFSSAHLFNDAVTPSPYGSVAGCAATCSPCFSQGPAER